MAAPLMRVLRLAFVLLLASCITTTTPIPQPAPSSEPATPAVAPRELIDVTARESTWLDLSRGWATASATIGGRTGVRSMWFRFEVKGRGAAEVTLLRSMGDTHSVALYDDAVVLHPELDSPEIGYRQVTSSPQSIASDLDPGIYYIKVMSGPLAQQTDFVVSVLFALAPTPTPITRQPTPRPSPPPPPRPAPVPTPTPTPAPVPTPQPPPAPLLVAPERNEAAPLSSGSIATTDIGGESGYRWRWYEVTMTRKGKLRLDVSADGAPVEVALFDQNGKQLDKLDVTGSALHSARHGAGKIFVRVGPAASDAAARVTLDVKIAIAGVTKVGN